MKTICIKDATGGMYWLCNCPACQREQKTAPERYKDNLPKYWTDDFGPADKVKAQQIFKGGYEPTQNREG